jgi:hypothetical protein
MPRKSYDSVLPVIVMRTRVHTQIVVVMAPPEGPKACLQSRCQGLDVWQLHHAEMITCSDLGMDRPRGVLAPVRVRLSLPKAVAGPPDMERRLDRSDRMRSQHTDMDFREGYLPPQPVQWQVKGK